MYVGSFGEKMYWATFLVTFFTKASGHLDQHETKSMWREANGFSCTHVCMYKAKLSVWLPGLPDFS
jgi:hypothetical protein